MRAHIAMGQRGGQGPAAVGHVWVARLATGALAPLGKAVRTSASGVG